MSWKKKILNAVNIFISFVFLCANYTFATPLSKYKLAAKSQVPDVAKATRRFSHLVRDTTKDKGESENFLYGMKIKDEQQRIIPEGQTITKPTQDQHERYLGMVQEHIERLEHIYGKGITALVDRILIVENLAGEIYGKGRAPLASYEDGVLKIDVQIFRAREEVNPYYIVFEALEHEFLESIIGEDVVATYRNVLRFLEPNKGVTDDKYRWDENEYRKQILASLIPPIDPDGKYQELLYFLSAQQNLSEDTIILSVVRYILSTKLYEKVRDQLGLPDELAKRIKETSIRLDGTLNAFNEIAATQNGKNLVEKIKTADLRAMHAVKTLNGIRVAGLDNINEELNRLIRAEARQVSNMDRLSGKLVKQDSVKYILVSEDRIKELKNAIGEDEYKSIEAKLKANNYNICAEAPAGTDLANVIKLVDPGDLKTVRESAGLLYLIFPYTRSSLYIAALVLQADGKWDALDPLVKQLIFDLYPELGPKDLSEFFTKPWDLLPKIQPVIDNIENLRKAIAIIEQAA